MDFLKETDGLILEYLLFRGFTETYHSFTQERKADKLKGLCSDKVVEQLFLDLEGSIENFLNLWEFIEERFFKVLNENKLVETADKLKNYLLKFYLIHSFKNAKINKVTEFFDKHIQHHCDVNRYSWREWYSLPFCSRTDAEQDPVFGSFFDPEWENALKLSLRNFLEQVFRSIPSPRLLAFNLSNRKIEAMKSKLSASEATIEMFKKEIGSLQLRLSNREQPIQGLEISESESNIRPKNTLKEASYEYQNTDNQEMPMPIPIPIPEPQDVVEEKLPENVSHIGSHTGSVNICRISAKGDMIVSGSNDATAKIWGWDSNMGKGLRNPRTIYCPSAVLSLDWHESNTYLALGTSTSVVKIWDSDARKTVNSIITSDPRLPHVVDVKFCPRSHLLVTANALMKTNNQIHEYLNPFGGDKSALQLWNWSTGQMQQKLKTEADTSARVMNLDLNHNGTLLVAGDSDGFIRIFDVSSGKPIMGWRAHNEEEGGIQRICLTPDETAVISLSDSGGITHWSLHKTGHSLATYPSVQNSMHGSLESRDEHYLGNKCTNGDICFIDNKKFLVAYPLYKDTLLYDTNNPLSEPLIVATGHTKGVTTIHSCTNRSFVSASLDKHVHYVTV